jgi:hypothetical protein
MIEEKINLISKPQATFHNTLTPVEEAEGICNMPIISTNSDFN